MTCPSRGAIEADEPSPSQDAVEDRRGQILVEQHLPPLVQGLVGGGDHGPLAQVPVVHHMEEHVGGVLCIGQVADLVHDEYVRVQVVSDSGSFPFLPGLERSSINSAAVVKSVSKPFWMAR
jgi:hypothetical protein